MEPSLIVLFLFNFVRVFALSSDDGVIRLSDQSACPKVLPQVENAKVSNSSLKSIYTQGDKLTYSCQEGYTGRITFICDGHTWVKTRKTECSRKRCELPSDIPNGNFMIVNGTDFVYGTTIKYICKKGYHMVNLVDTRTCLAGGWSNRLPECKELSCIPPETDRNITVDGIYNYDSPIRPGHTLQFRCNSPELNLDGPNEITCNENGDWSDSFPRCVETICEIEEIQNQVSVVGLPKNDASMKYGHKLQFYCPQLDMVLSGSKEVSCSAGGKWSHPFPICEEIICKEEKLINIRIVNGFPGIVPPFKPQHTLHFQCINSRFIMRGESSVTCRFDGKWSSPYPTCSARDTCEPPPVFEFAVLTTLLKSFYNSGETISYSCPQFYTMTGNPTLTCHQGKWNGMLKCLKPCILSIEQMDTYNIQQYYGQKRIMYSAHGQYIRFACQDGTYARSNVNDFYQPCSDGHMQLPYCQ
ncbi:complement factor H-like [Trichomycterus rosablanca]|uniref:complement factor H-like n=1 Tax=Trichomycterus rosablanca TaxID=2290929 RepID=UPI002F3502E7